MRAKRDFERSTREQAIQEVDRESGVPVWTVDVVDADPEARDKNTPRAADGQLGKPCHCAYVGGVTWVHGGER